MVSEGDDMSRVGRVLAAIAVASLLAGCAIGPARHPESKSQRALSAGIEEYEDGKYVDAAKDIQGALDLGLVAADQVRAHKFLPFIMCISGKDRLCRDEFRKALEINPNMELAPAEAGHPIWGP